MKSKQVTQNQVGEERKNQQASERELLRQSFSGVDEFTLQILQALARLLPVQQAKHQDNIEKGISIYKKLESNKKFREARVDHVKYVLNDCFKKLESLEADLQRSTVNDLVVECTERVEKRQQLRNAAGKVAAIYEKLDLKTKFLMAVADELSALSGIDIECFNDFFQRSYQETGKRLARVKDGILTAQDADLKYLREIYDLASYINETS